jgi:hypothetical protein
VAVLRSDQCEVVLELVGYHYDPDDPRRVTRVTDGTVQKFPKGIYFPRMDDDETVESDILRYWLVTRQGLHAAAVDAAITHVLGLG